MELDVILWAAGIMIAVGLAFLGGRMVIRKNSQKASAKEGSTVIQSGRDTNLK